MKRNILISLSIMAFLISCAKERDISKLTDPDGDWKLRSNLVSNNEKKPKLWMYKTTVVKTSDNNGFAFVGLQNDPKIGFFHYEQNKLFILSKIIFKY